MHRPKPSAGARSRPASYLLVIMGKLFFVLFNKFTGTIFLFSNFLVEFLLKLKQVFVVKKVVGHY